MWIMWKKNEKQIFTQKAVDNIVSNVENLWIPMCTIGLD